MFSMVPSTKIAKSLVSIKNIAARAKIYRGFYTSAHILLNLLSELGKSDKRQGLQSILSLFSMSLINSIIQEP